jgi:NADH-quinone oxidoreductase subunit M
MLSIIGIIFIGLTCLKVNHIKQIIAYSSIIHMNAVCLGLFTNKIISFSGSIYAMLSHSLISSSLFMLAGILYTKYQSYYIENYSGLSYNMPYFCFFFIFILFANIAIPLTSGFIAELLILIDLSKYNLFIFLIFFTNYMLNTGYSI